MGLSPHPSESSISEPESTSGSSDEDFGRRPSGSSSDDQELETALSNANAQIGDDPPLPMELSNGKRKKRSKRRKSGARSEADKRFESVVEQLRARASDELWVSLGSCGVHDARMAALTEALAQNSTVTALDLSRNNITEDGAKALLEALGSGAASDLIELDLRGNPFTTEHLKNLAHLWSSRKQLTVLVGALQGAESHVSVSPFALQANQIEEEEEEVEEEIDFSDANGFSSPLIRRFFQVGGGEDEPKTDPAEPQEPPEDPEIVAARLWGQVEEATQLAPEDNAALSEALRGIVDAVKEEMASCALPMLDSTTADDLKPHTAAASGRIGLLPPMLDRVPPPVLWPTSGGMPQAAVGSHRLAVADLAAVLVGAGTVFLDEAIASSGILSRLVQLCFSHPACNALHSSTLKLLRAAFASKISELWSPLLEPGMGIACSGDAGAAFCAPPPPLQRQLAAVGIAAADMLGGRRPPITGFAVAVASLLRSHAGEGHASGILQQRLEAEEEWADFAEEGGPLAQLLGEQEGELCGPRPRPALLEGLAGAGRVLTDAEGNALQNGAGAGGNSYLMNCRDLASYLQVMPRLSGSLRSG